ncbi:hypothetical protein TVAG_094400 [Trichomonas vaginalis G3]|uniref:HECT-type E3 ubiquitin transferase n=1 Tax=Trichomonas vaginalis (strain ATCC PRA-98 / G3) TaxID=412133 RepID=A2DBR2_TRIV3|nr:ubiquitin protein ligase protein [Trichomonas vaginalis G3]EAY22265.1 hypothetical protein TVAG_094400 [Trichomonas vaginalis G3]KAI5533265.1 ubiquitin protein ligase protein [Trichomonas vaginalis G3]|eukprot:XP_001583251.1 hypothetical protein [Trichomonas vaginalis G3]
MILRAFEKEIPSNLSDAKMVLEFFNTPNFDSYFRDMDKMNIRDYFNRLVIFIFERKPDTIVKKQNHSELINECAKTYIPSLWELGQDSSNCERRMPLLLLYSDEGASFNKFVSTGSIYYPIEILLTNGKTEILPKGKCPNPYQCKGYRYHFGADGNQVLEDWRNYKLKDFRELYNLLLVQYILKNKIAESQIGDYPAIVLYFVNIGLSNIKELPDDLFDYQGQDAQKLYDYVKRTISGDNRNCIFLKIEIKYTIARGENINSPNFKTIFGYLMDSGFPQRLYSDEIIYHADYTDEKGVDVGGLFRDSFYFIVEELMNLNLKYFTNKPISLLCESDCLVPSITLSPRQAETIGALISSAIATQNCHRKWKIPLFIWNSFVTDAKFSALVDCNDGDYFNELEKVVTNMRNGFWKVLPLQEVSNLSGRFLKGLACGKEGALDYNSFINLFDERTKSLSIWNTFKQAISNFTSEQFCKLLQFITGIDTPSMKSGYFLKLCEVPTNLKNEEEYLLPFAHTCFLQLDIMPYKSADLLRQKLIVCINNYSTMTG